MALWRYNLNETGEKLKDLIQNDSQPEIIEQLIVCYKSLLNMLLDEDREDFEMAIEEQICLLDGEADVIRYSPEVIINDWDYESIEELIDNRLNEFYDICDDCRCWVAL